MTSVSEAIKRSTWNTWGRVFALISCICMIFMPSFLLLTISMAFLVGIWISAGFVLLFELPFLNKCFRADSTGERITLSAQSPLFRALCYTGMSILLWCTCQESVTILIIPAITLSISTISLFISVLKRESSARDTSTDPVLSNAEAGKV